MAIKCMTKDGKVPVGLRMEPEQYEILRRWAYECGTTPNKAIVETFFLYLEESGVLEEYRLTEETSD